LPQQQINSPRDHTGSRWNLEPGFHCPLTRKIVAKRVHVLPGDLDSPVLPAFICAGAIHGITAAGYMLQVKGVFHCFLGIVARRNSVSKSLMYLLNRRMYGAAVTEHFRDHWIQPESLTELIAFRAL